MANWYLVPSLKALLREFNEGYRLRDRSSDGTIGDAAHSSRTSDHNPDWKGAVHAIDVDEDLFGVGNDQGQQEMRRLLLGVVRNRDPRVKYLIYEGLIWRSYDKPGLQAWTPEKYTGSNPHDKHAHFSVLDTEIGENDTSPWLTARGPAPAPTPTPNPPALDEDEMWIHSSPWTGQALVAGDTVTWIQSPDTVSSLRAQGVPVFVFDKSEADARRVIDERTSLRDDIVRIQWQLADIQNKVAKSE